MKIFSKTSKKYLSESGFQFEGIMKKRNDPDEKALRVLKKNRDRRLKEKSLENCI